jgi:putative transposase
MPRSARIIADEGFYHLLNRGNGQQQVFQKAGDYQAFLQLLAQTQQEFNLELFAYCLMPNHFHLLVKVQKSQDLSRGMQWFMTTHVRRYHRHYRSSGHLWQGRYKSFAIEDDDHFLTVARYIEGNPVRAGLVGTALDWEWSSHQRRCKLLRGLAPQVPVPVRDETAERGQSLAKEGLSPAIPTIAAWPIAVETNWTEFVDMPLTGRELAKTRRLVARQRSAG